MKPRLLLLVFAVSFVAAQESTNLPAKSNPVLIKYTDERTLKEVCAEFEREALSLEKRVKLRLQEERFQKLFAEVGVLRKKIDELKKLDPNSAIKANPSARAEIDQSQIFATNLRQRVDQTIAQQFVKEVMDNKIPVTSDARNERRLEDLTRPKAKPLPDPADFRTESQKRVSEILENPPQRRR